MTNIVLLLIWLKQISNTEGPGHVLLMQPSLKWLKLEISKQDSIFRLSQLLLRPEFGILSKFLKNFGRILILYAKFRPEKLKKNTNKSGAIWNCGTFLKLNSVGVSWKEKVRHLLSKATKSQKMSVFRKATLKFSSKMVKSKTSCLNLHWFKST